MKKTFLKTFGIIFLFANTCFAQQIKRCGTMENLERLKQTDPTIEEQMLLIEEHTQRYLSKYTEIGRAHV